jgi:hypothetical protein
VIRAADWARRSLAAGAALACAGPAGQGADAYFHSRTDYENFREAHPGLLEPNYLPFMTWLVQLDDGDALIFCRWPQDAFPLDVHVAEPEIGEALEDEFHPTPPGAFVGAVERALATWQAELGGLVSFRRAVSSDAARLTIRLIAEEALVPDPGVKVLGTTPLGDACRVEDVSRWRRLRSWLGIEAAVDPELDAVRVHYDVPELWVYIADEFGLLNPDQVERIALHEIGHALGMRSHSPVPNDLMFQTVLEGPGPARLSMEDIGSFVSLYALPSGAVYRRLKTGQGGADPPGPPTDSPELSLAPHVDARRGFEIQLPVGWLKVETPTGFAAVDGTTWDYTASLQLIVRRFPSIDAYLARHASAHVRDGTVLAQGEVRVAGQRAFQLVVQSADGRLVDRTTLIEMGDGRVLVAIGDCAPEDCGAYEPWFEASLATLEIRGGERRGAHDRDYRRDP